MEEDPIEVRIGKGVTLTFRTDGLPPMAELRPEAVPENVSQRLVTVACRRARFQRMASLLRSGVLTEEDVRRC